MQSWSPPYLRPCPTRGSKLTATSKQPQPPFQSAHRLGEVGGERQGRVSLQKPSPGAVQTVVWSLQLGAQPNSPGAWPGRSHSRPSCPGALAAGTVACRGACTGVRGSGGQQEVLSAQKGGARPRGWAGTPGSEVSQGEARPRTGRRGQSPSGGAECGLRGAGACVCLVCMHVLRELSMPSPDQPGRGPRSRGVCVCAHVCVGTCAHIHVCVCMCVWTAGLEARQRAPRTCSGKGCGTQAGDLGRCWTPRGVPE